MANISFKAIQWGSTLWVNFLRAIATGLVVSVIFLFVEDRNAPPPFVYLVVIPIGYFLFFLPLALIGIGIGRFVGMANLLALPAFLFVVPGDPLVFFLRMAKPSLVPTDHFGFFNFHAVLVVQDHSRL